MLILSRRTGESLLIEPNPEMEGDSKDWFADGPIRLRINAVTGNQVRLGIEAPRAIRILREELVNPSIPDRETAPRAALARKVQLLRAMRRWSSEDLAQAAGVPLTVVASVESAGGHVELMELEALARTFGLTVAELFLPDGRTRSSE